MKDLAKKFSVAAKKYELTLLWAKLPDGSYRFKLFAVDRAPDAAGGAGKKECDEAKRQFRSLGTRAGKLIDPGAAHPLRVWLEALVRRFAGTSDKTGINPRKVDGKWVRCRTGSLDAFKFSAALCTVLETKAVREQPATATKEDTQRLAPSSGTREGVAATSRDEHQGAKREITPAESVGLAALPGSGPDRGAPEVPAIMPQSPSDWTEVQQSPAMAESAPGADANPAQVIADPPAAEAAESAEPVPRFPNRAAWLRHEMAVRGFRTPYQFNQAGGPDVRTIQRILDGQPVRWDSLNRIATGLSSTGTPISEDQIPSN